MTEQDSQIHDMNTGEMTARPDSLAAREPVEASEPTSAAGRLRAFEDAKLGPDAVRIDGMVERGSGSPFAALSDKDKEHYAALEKLVVAEQKLDDSVAAISQAEADHAAAMAAVEKAEADAAASE